MRLLFLIFLAVPAFATNYTSAAAGSCATSTNWTPNGVPGDGDRITVIHAMTSCGITIGTAATMDVAGTGTVAQSSGNLTGSSTLFLTEMAVGDSITIATSINPPCIVLTITNDTTATLDCSQTLAAGKSFTIRDFAVFVKSPGTITVQAGGTLTLHGDLNNYNRTVTFTDANIVFDSATEHYRYMGFIGTLQALAGASRASVSSTTAYGRIFEGGGGNAGIFNNVDFTNVGDATHALSTLGPTSGLAFKYSGCTFTNSGALLPAFAASAAADFIFTGNKIISLPASFSGTISWLTIGFAAATTGARTLTNNVLDGISAHALISLALNNAGFTITNNVLNGLQGAAAGAPGTNFSGNFFYTRAPSNDTTGSTFFGCGGDSHTSNYFLEDEGDGQASPHGWISGDACAVTGTFIATGNVYERTGTPRGTYLVGEPSGAPTQASTYQWDHSLVIPDYQGYGPVLDGWRGTSLTTGNYNWNTALATVMPDSGSGNTGALQAGGQYAGRADMFAQTKNNLSWSKTAAYPGGGTGNLLAFYSNVSPAADIITAAGVLNNAYYNNGSGQMCNGAGAACQTVLGWGGFRSTVVPTSFTGDMNLGTGTDERTQGPRFGDSTRNVPTFDTAYLNNTASAWVNSHSYSIGDIVSAATSTYYPGGPTINYVCIKAHTSDSTSPTNGKPGSTVTMVTGTIPPSGYRVNWEFATVKRIKDAIYAGTTITDGAIGAAGSTYVQSLIKWAQKGFTPQNPALWCAATDGTSIGAVDFCGKGKVMLSAIAF